MTPAANKDLLRRFFEEIWNRRRLDRFDDYVTPDFATSATNAPSMHGRDAFRSATKEFLDAVPDYHIELLDLIAEEDRVAVRWRCAGTHQGPLLGLAATGRRFSLTGISIYRVRDGKLAEVWRERDFPGMWRQLLPDARIDKNGLPEHKARSA